MVKIKRKCFKCNKKITLNGKDKNSHWIVLNFDGTKHRCAVKKSTTPKPVDVRPIPIYTCDCTPWDCTHYPIDYLETNRTEKTIEESETNR